MPRKSEPTPSPWAKAVADSIKTEIDRRGVSGNELGVKIGRSGNYVAMRFRHEASFTISDVEAIAKYLEVDGGLFLDSIRTEEEQERVINFPTRNVGPAEQDDDIRAEAATDDETTPYPQEP